MIDDNQLTADEAKYFETGGKEAPVTPEAVVEETEVERESEKQPSEANDESRKELIEEKKALDAKKTPPEIEVVDDDDGEGEPDQRKYVKVGVLRKEREQRKALKSEIEQARQQNAALQQQLEQAKNPPREIAPEEAGQVALQELQRRAAVEQEQQAKSNFVSNWQRTAQEFTKEQPDFIEAYNHALGIRRFTYEEAGYAPQQVSALLESEEAALVEKANIEGKNPAKVIYEIAKKYGYTAKAKEEVKDPIKDVVKNAEKLANIAKGMEKNKSVSGGGSADSTPTLGELAEMDDAEFDKMAGDPKKWKALMGG